MSDPVQVKRTREIESISNLYVIHPISRQFVSLFARLGLKPNAVSVLGIVFGILAAAAYYHYESWQMSLLGFFSMIMWHIMDGADGQLARLTGQTSDLGKIMDGLCDHVTVALVYISLAVAGTMQHGIWVAVVVVAAGLSHIVQSSAYEFQRQMYDFWVYGKETARFVTVDEQRETVQGATGIARAFAKMYLLYLTIQHRFSAFDETLDRQLRELTRSGDPIQSRARDLYRTLNISALRRWSFLSSNPRTVAIFLVCLIKQPVLYFLLEVTVVNVVLVLLVRMQTRRHGLLRARLDEMGASAERTVTAVR